MTVKALSPQIELEISCEIWSPVDSKEGPLSENFVSGELTEVQFMNKIPFEIEK